MDIKRVIKGTEEYNHIYQLATEWWTFWKFPAPPIDFLPNNMICAYNENVPVCIGFLYQTDSKISWLEFIVANNKASKQDRALAIEMVLSTAKVLASAMGFGTVFTTSKNQSLNSKLEKKYTKTDMGVTHFIGRV